MKIKTIALSIALGVVSTNLYAQIESLTIAKLPYPIDAVGIADVTGDGLRDTATLFNNTTGANVVVINDGITNKRYQTISLGRSFKSKALLNGADRDGDGYPDLAVMGINNFGVTKLYYVTVNSKKPDIGFDGFALTTGGVRYSDNPSINPILCSKEFGSDWVKADTDDLINYVKSGGNLSTLEKELGLKSAWVNFGTAIYKPGQGYYVKPISQIGVMDPKHTFIKTWAVHSNLNPATKPVLCVRK